jgi:N-acetylmuramoyl-L-alanine amidase
MNIREQFLGMVRKGVFYILAPQGFEKRPMRLTRIQMTAAAGPEAEEIDLSDYEDKVILVNGDSGGGGSWIYSAGVAEEAGPVVSNFLETYFSEEERQKKLCALVIGHQPDKPGAVNTGSSISEFEFNKDLARRIERNVQKARLQKVYRTTYEELPGEINALNPDFIVSLHCNSYDSAASGTEVLYCRSSGKGKEIAGILLRHLVEHLGLQNRGIKPRKKGELGYGVLCLTDAPAVIAEPFFISNDLDLARAREDLDGLAKAYADAIDEIAGMIGETAM